MIDRVFKLASRHGLITTTICTCLGGAALWTILSSGNLWAGSAGLAFGLILDPLIYWRTKRDIHGEAVKPTDEPSTEEIATLKEYRTFAEVRWRRWLFLMLPPAGALAGFIATNFLFDAERFTWVAILWSLILGGMLAVR